jgi:AcrR family transcriptional regulator
MTIGDVAADAGVSRPTLYRRWATKHDLVVEALRYGYQKQCELCPTVDLTALPPKEAIKEAVRRLNPCYANAAAMTLMGDFMAEAERIPLLIAQLREHGVRPRCNELLDVLQRLRDRGEIRADVDLEVVVTLCFGSYFAAHLRTSELNPEHADTIVNTLWPTLAP